MPMKILVRVQVLDAEHSGEFDFEIPINMTLDMIRNEILELMGWNKPGLRWDISVPSKKNALQTDTMEGLMCWDDTALLLRSRDIDNDMLIGQTIEPQQGGVKLEGISK